MAIDLDADLAGCFSTDDFGTPAVFDIAEPITVNGHFTDGTDAVEMYGIQIEASQPSLACPTSEIADVTRGTAVTIEGSEYTAEKIMRVGTGVSLVYLKT